MLGEEKMNKKTVLITGASSGLGSSLVRKYASNNYNVIMTYLTHEKEAKNIKKELEDKYDTKILAIKCDLSNEDDINNLYNESIKEFKTIDILINNAGIAKDADINDKTKEDFMHILEVNLVGPFLLTRLIANSMYENKSGKIVNIASNNGIDAYYEYSLDYDASKAALINMTHNLANKYAPYININCVCPGWINTNMNKDMDESYKKQEEDKILLKRFAQPEEIANLVYFLSSDEASYINDSIIRVDGGIKHE
jgi:3-oxoacyl-[acyl-carrier protein] reductase